MKVHILFANEHTNGRVAGVWTDIEKAKSAFHVQVQLLALQHSEPVNFRDTIFSTDELLSYMPDDTEEHSNVKVMLFLDCEVAS